MRLPGHTKNEVHRVVGVPHGSILQELIVRPIFEQELGKHVTGLEEKIKV